MPLTTAKIPHGEPTATNRGARKQNEVKVIFRGKDIMNNWDVSFSLSLSLSIDIYTIYGYKHIIILKYTNMCYALRLPPTSHFPAYVIFIKVVVYVCTHK